MDTKTAALNSLYVILFSQIASFISTVLRGTVPEFEWSVLLVMVIGGIVGGNMGRSISKKLSNSDVDRLFFWLLIVITAISFYNLVNCFV